ncbi:uncharacterized protein RJT21DRAFT_112337 [Scheffersomyces amazonensis]|uniref:uncharacterized protein n=1 Tax=Scheffersomyces amazonensis TaxID=1078765 RepID=UPI00315C5283
MGFEPTLRFRRLYLIFEENKECLGKLPLEAIHECSGNDLLYKVVKKEAYFVRNIVLSTKPFLRYSSCPNTSDVVLQLFNECEADIATINPPSLSDHKLKRRRIN